MNKMQHIIKLIVVVLMFSSCSEQEKVTELNFGYIGPLSTRATFLGIGPAKAIELTVEQYNKDRKEGEPKINFFYKDDKWEKDLALPMYKKLRKEHNIDVIFMSNTDGTVSIQEEILKDNVICVNPLNSDELLSNLNDHTFKVAKNTEDANGLVGHRILELGLNKTAIFHFPNDYMTRAAKAVEKVLKAENKECKVITSEKNQVDFKEQLIQLKVDGYDSYTIFGYNNFGHTVRQARELGIEAPFFGSNTFLEEEFYDNSNGTCIGAEFAFFTTVDGNEILADKFIQDYVARFNEKPTAVWPTLQACDASNMVIDIVRNINKKNGDEAFVMDDWIIEELFKTTYYEGVCGNLSVGEDGAARGIYFSLYRCVDKMKIEKVN